MSTVGEMPKRSSPHKLRSGRGSKIVTDVERLKAHVMTSIVEHLITSGGALATPGSEVARVRRDVMRGLRDTRLTLTGIGSARSHR